LIKYICRKKKKRYWRLRGIWLDWRNLNRNFNNFSNKNEDNKKINKKIYNIFLFTKDRKINKNFLEKLKYKYINTSSYTNNYTINTYSYNNLSLFKLYLAQIFSLKDDLYVFNLKYGKNINYLKKIKKIKLLNYKKKIRKY